MAQRRRHPIGGFHPVDVVVGRNVKHRRRELGLSQTALGSKVGLTFQQIQKYERGANRIGSSRLYQFAGILEVPVSYFFEGVEDGPTDGNPSMTERPEPFEHQDVFATPEVLEFVEAYYSISDSAVRLRIRELTKVVASSG